MRDDSPRHGDLVEVRGAAEILATLDERGMLDGLPFMPEMVRFCGRRLVVDKRASKICDTIFPLGTRTLPDTLLLGNLRCDGSGHDSCQADCRLYWKEAWVRRVGANEPPAVVTDADARKALAEFVAGTTRATRDADGQATVRYRCQATELHRASVPLSTWDPRPYIHEYSVGNVGLARLVRVVARAAVEEPLRKLGITPRVYVSGPGGTVAREPALGLQPGDLVQVKSKEEIIATLTADGKNRGLFFDREMLPYCGGTFRVKQRVTRFIDDRSGGRMIELKSDCVTLEGVVCSGDLSPVRWLCPREIQSFWREAWLRRVDAEPAAGQAQRAVSDHSEHHSGLQQVDPAEILSAPPTTDATSTT